MTGTGMTDTAHEPPTDRPPVSAGVAVVRTVVGAAGLAGIGYGLAGLLDEPAYVDQWGVLRWVVGGLLVHDVLFAAAVFTVGWLVMRLLPGKGPAPWMRRTVLGGLAVGTAATLITLPALLRPGIPPNPSVLPLDYGRNLAVVWGIVAAGTGMVIAVRKWWARRPA